MSNEVVVQNDFAQQLKEFEQIQDTCKKLLATKHYAALGEAGIHAIIARAKALGIHPFEALNGGFICINGKIGLSTEMMAALVRKRGHSITKDPRSNDECVILHGKRADNGDTWTCSFSRSDAEAAGLWNTATWKKYGKIMLYNRAMSQLFRQLFPDLSLGAGYVEDELKEITRTGDYAHPGREVTIDIVTEKEEQKKIDVKPLDRPVINESQLNCLLHFIDSDEQARNEILGRLGKINVFSLDKIPVEIFEKVLNVAKEGYTRREEEAKRLKEESAEE